jgi:hypothetical protein
MMTEAAEKSATVTPLRPADADVPTAEPVMLTLTLPGNAAHAANICTMVATTMRNCSSVGFSWSGGKMSVEVIVTPSTQFPIEKVRISWRRIVTALHALHAPLKEIHTKGNSSEISKSSPVPEAEAECPTSSPPASEG